MYVWMVRSSNGIGVSLKHGKPRAIYMVLLCYSRFALFLVIPSILMAYLEWSPWILDYPLFAFAMFFASLWQFGLFMPVIGVVIVTAILAYLFLPPDTMPHH